MKRRIMLSFVMLLAVFGLVACRETTTVTTVVDATERVDAPANLSLSATGKVLSWSAVPGVTIYKVYVGGVETATVMNRTTYDFSGLTGDSLVFTVVAVGPSGYDDSVPSVSIAYVADPAAVIAAINNVADAEGMELPDGVAAELTAKGITGPIFQGDVDAIQAFQTAMQSSEGDMEAMNLALSTLIDEVDNIEAYISAFLVVVPDLIDEEIAVLDEDLLYYESMLDIYPDDEDYLQQVDELNAEIDRLNALKTMVVENADDIVVTVKAVADYLIDVQGQISGTLVAEIEALMGNENPTSAEIVLVKNEVASLLLDNLPSVDDLTLVFDLLAVLEDAMNGDETSMTAGYANEYANEVHIMFEIVIRFIQSLDAAFIDDMMALDEATITEVEASTEREILFLLAFASFKDANQALLDNLDGVFTAAQKQAAFESMLASFGELMLAQGAPQEAVDVVEDVILDLTYALADAGATVFDSMAEKLLDHLVATDGELIRAAAIQSNFREDLDYETWEFVYVNYYTGEEYATYTDYRYARQLNQADLLDAVFAMFDATVGTLTEAEFAALADLVLSMIPEETLAAQADVAVTVVENLVATVDTSLGDQDQNAIAVLSSLIGYVNDNDVFGAYGALVTRVHNQNVIDFGADYMDNYEFDESYGTYATIILIAHHLDAWMTPTIATQIDGIVAEAFDVMSTADFLALSGKTIDEVNDMEAAIVAMIDDLVAQAAVIADYNESALTADQKTEIQDFIAIIQNALGEPAK
ncbi:MAG: hypothetical protein WC509_01845 [Candidatus Izemoplasmatales bacterium]